MASGLLFIGKASKVEALMLLNCLLKVVFDKL
jgi:hypothetical protein